MSFPAPAPGEMLAAAAELFYEHGYAATSTADIAERMGIQRGSVYYYFDTKEGLLLELIEDVYRHALRVAGAACGRATPTRSASCAR